MKTWFKKQTILLLLILVGVGAALGVVIHRVTVEEANKSYDIVMDYASLEEMVEESENDMDFWLPYFRQLGVDKLAIREESVDSLVSDHQGLVQAQHPANICSQYGWQQCYPQTVQEKLLNSRHSSDILVSVADPALFSWIQEAFEARTDVEIWSYSDESGDGFFFLTGDGKKITGVKLMTLPLGMDPEKVTMAQEYGYTLIPRTIPVKELNGDTFAEAVLRDYEALGNPYIISGRIVLGEDNPETALPRMQSFLNQHPVALGMVENNDQSKNQVDTQLETLIEQTNYNVLRVFSMWDYVQWRYGWYNYDGPQEITNCLYRAAYERNCRLIYLKMILNEDPENPGTYEYITEPEAYDRLLGDFITRMDQRGYTMKTLTAAEPVTVSFLSVVLMALGAVAAAVLLLGLVFPMGTRLTYALTLLGALGAAGVLYVMPNTGRLVLSIGGGIVMPLLAIVLLDRALDHFDRKHLVPEALGAVAALVVLCLVGGLFAAAPLSDSAYMLELKLYRGVKVMQLVPLAGFVLYLFKYYLGSRCTALVQMPQEQRKARVETILDMPVKVRNVITVVLAVALLGILAAVGSYYLARTGHTQDVGMADLELELRNLMEYYLTARPRTKEFLIGYPCVMLYVWSKRKNTPATKVLAVIFGLGAVIGATSIVNTFLHIRTTYLLSLIRVLTGLIAGIAAGLVALALAQLIYRLITKRTKHV